MSQPTVAPNPFELMLNPEGIFAAIERSERLARLKSRICRPLDGPRPTAAPSDGIDATPPTEAAAASAPAATSGAFEPSISALLGDDDTPADFGTGV